MNTLLCIAIQYIETKAFKKGMIIDYDARRLPDVLFL